jgi:hypothetical protein
MVIVGLGCVFGVFPLPVQRILGNGRGEHAPLAVHDRDADAQSSEINAGDYGHSKIPLNIFMSFRGLSKAKDEEPADLIGGACGGK